MAPGVPGATNHFRSVDMTYAGLVEAVSTALGRSVVLDDWRPNVQGVVGHVIGVRDEDGIGYAVKLFPPSATDRVTTELGALRLVAAVPGVPAARALVSGRYGDDGGHFVVLERLPGRRWGDRRDELDDAQTRRLLAAVAHLLRSIHTVKSDRFGELVEDRRCTDGWSWLQARFEQRLGDYVACGGDEHTARRGRAFVEVRQSAMSDASACLCHHDVNGGNVLVAATGEPDVTGVVDWEAAGWDDPMADLALARLHVRYHEPHLLPGLWDAYGLTDAEHSRLEVHELLLAMTERAWVCLDRPSGWRASAERLDAVVHSLLDG